ncbi:ATP-binding protein [Kitasatospora sp. GP82]|uniref:ATP-binding protein n=1 Tax=Kitasatospora sp. GP82 TaxID=3035089 RepID=UPI0024753669|nr:ATP-binding protein [Kitasatospora sp. GP82]MDH6127581.1 serine/threonine-protein kinase RsbW [Kitasatospora sp. GP82]
MPEVHAGPPALAGEQSCWLPRHQKSASEARRLLRAFLAELDGGERLIDVGELLLSELVTNAVSHARVSPGRLIQVRLEVVASQLRIEVHDASSDRPVIRPVVGGDAESGRGLRLVDSLAAAWGCCPRQGGIGKFVWALVGPMEGES